MSFLLYPDKNDGKGPKRICMILDKTKDQSKLNKKMRIKLTLLDQLEFKNNFEDPKQYEDLIISLHSKAAKNNKLFKILESAFLEPDRLLAFRRFLDSGVPENLSFYYSRFGIGKPSVLCDFGCGPGHLSWSLNQLGFKMFMHGIQIKNTSPGQVS